MEILFFVECEMKKKMVTVLICEPFCANILGQNLFVTTSKILFVGNIEISFGQRLKCEKKAKSYKI